MRPSTTSPACAARCGAEPGGRRGAPGARAGHRLDSGDAGLRETLDLCREGRELVELCAGGLEAVGAGLEDLRLDELVTRLEAGRVA